MRITRETLLKIARDTIARRAREKRDLLAVYLSGSLLEDEFMLGGATDIDLFFIHMDQVATEREIVRLTDEVHLDIAHCQDEQYRQARNLRLHPWLGPALNGCTVMYDPQHFMDFTQASVRGQFDRPDYVLQRARDHLEKARQIWLGYQVETSPDPGPCEAGDYLRALAQAANAVASLSGPPLTERRFLAHFAQRAGAIGRPGLYAGLLGLLGAGQVDGQLLTDCLAHWGSAYESIPREKAPARLHPDRRMYYQGAFQAFIAGQQPEVVLYPLLRTWTMAVGLLPPNSPGCSAWRQALTRLEILGEAFAMRMTALDAYLDLVEETLEEWARQNGAWVEI
ncbi:MAG: hypothetical protein JXA78_02220 [Anaerolineales bacterium]|nr:hypothetical protein [Anaerolineales bacterium]